MDSWSFLVPTFEKETKNTGDNNCLGIIHCRCDRVRTKKSLKKVNEETKLIKLRLIVIVMLLIMQSL